MTDLQKLVEATRDCPGCLASDCPNGLKFRNAVPLGVNACRGTGKLPPIPGPTRPCPRCKGTGGVPGGKAYGDPNDQLVCERCSGKGWVPVPKAKVKKKKALGEA